jgi:Zn-dependent hydrolases, including glyoxylases
MKNIILENVAVGMIATNCMLIINKTTKEAIIVDPGDSADEIAQAVTKADSRPVAILLTHGHFDHTWAVDDIRTLYDIPAYAYEDEAELLADSVLNHSAKYGRAYTVKPEYLLTDGEELNLAGMHIIVMHTPGHTKGCCCYYLPDEETLISGDTLFYETVGRTDLETSNNADMQKSIKDLLSKLPEEVKVYPGHGRSTTIGYEKRYNPFA